MTKNTHPVHALLFPSVLLLAAVQVGCGSGLGKHVELDATRAALDAQMKETARLERNLMEAEANAVLPVPNEHQPPSDTKVPPQIPVDDPDAAVAAAEAGKKDAAEVPTEPFQPEEEEVEEVKDPEALATATALEVVSGEVVEPDPWTQFRSDLGGGSGRAGTDTLLLMSSIDRVARAIEQQNMLNIMEARLQDKQRLMDDMRGDLDRRTLGLVETPTAEELALDPRVATQLEAMAASQKALAAQLAAVQQARVDEKAAADAKAIEDAKAAELAQKEAAAKKAQADRDAAEQARWDSLMGRLTPAEQAKAQAAATPAAAPTGPVAPDDPRIMALEGQLKELQAARDDQKKQDQEAAKAQQARRLEEREQGLAAMEARYAALSAQQEAALSQIEDERRQQRKWWQFWRGQQKEGTAAAPPQDPAIVQAQIDVLKAETRAEWDELLARQEAEQAAEAADRDAAAADRAALEARLTELNARLEQVGTKPEVDPAELARMQELAASVEALRARTGDLEAATIAKQQRMQARLQPIIDAGLQVSIKDDRARIHLPSDVLFNSGKSVLAAAGLSTVDTVGATLAKATGLKVQVEGHTDNVPIAGSTKTNWDLGFSRAKAVLDRLIAKGVPSDRISAASYGDTRPVAANDTADGRSLNRRIEIVVLLAD